MDINAIIDLVENKRKELIGQYEDGLMPQKDSIYKEIIWYLNILKNIENGKHDNRDGFIKIYMHTQCGDKWVQVASKDIDTIYGLYDIMNDSLNKAVNIRL